MCTNEILISKFRFPVFWVATHIFQPRRWRQCPLRKVINRLQDYTVLQPRRPQFELALLLKVHSMCWV
jgi:hypothetical protein